MQKCLAFGRGIKILDKKAEGVGGSTNPPASLRVNVSVFDHVDVSATLDLLQGTHRAIGKGSCQLTAGADT